MLINLRNALMTGKRLPYDAEVEYLESTGTQWIDTGIFAAYNMKITADCQYVSNTSATQILFGPSANGGNWFGNTSGKFGVGARTTQQCGTSTTRAVIDFTWLTNDTTATNVTTGAVASYGNVPTLTQTNNIRIFGAGGSTSYLSYARVYHLKIIDENGVLVRDFIPVRKGTVGYLYDRVSGKLFGNAGTGDFVLGQDVVPVEWLESHGTEYIDTGTLVEMTDKVDCTFELLAYGDVTLAGGRINSSISSWAVWAYTNSARCIRFDLIGNNGGGVVQSITPTIGREYKVSKIGLNNFVDGVRVNGNTSTTYTPSRPCYLFAMNNGGTASFFGNYRIKDFSIGSKLKYRPVRVGTDATSWEGAMMDVLTRRIYRNQGTGAFGYGNDLKYPIPAA